MQQLCASSELALKSGEALACASICSACECCDSVACALRSAPTSDTCAWPSFFCNRSTCAAACCVGYNRLENFQSMKAQGQQSTSDLRCSTCACRDMTSLLVALAIPGLSKFQPLISAHFCLISLFTGLVRECTLHFGWLSPSIAAKT